MAAEGARVEQTFDEITASVNLLTSNIDRHKVAIIDLQKDLVSLGIAYKQATKADKSGILEEIELTKKNLIDEKAAVISLTAEVRQLEKQKKAAAVVSDDTNTMAQNAGKAAVGYNGLGMSVQQIVREMPAATMGLNMFFLAISNNVPILTDNIKRAKAENEALKASGQTSVPVWKQLAGSLFSWQSLMMVGITILSMYGKDIVAWVEKLFGAQQAIDKTTESQKAMNKVFADFTGEASRKIQDVTRLGIEIEKYGNNAQNAKSIISEFNKTFNTHYTTIQQVKNAYPEMSRAAIEAAIKIQAANSLIQKSAQYTLQKQQADTALAPYSASQIAEQEKMVNRLFDLAKRRGVDFNELTTSLMSGEGIQSILPAQRMMSGEDSKLISFYQNPDNLWFAKYIAQQRKATKQIDLNNKEIQKSLSGVDFKDFTNENLTKDTKPKNEKQYYDAAKAMGRLITDVEKETGNLILQAQDDFLQTKLDKVSIEQENELALIKQKSKDIVDEYNKSHKNDKGFKPLSTKDEDLTASLTTVSPKKDEKTGLTQSEQLEKDITNITKAYADKRAKIQQDYYDEADKLAKGMADARVKIEQEYEDKIKEARTNGAEAYAQQLELERDKKISETTKGLIEETNAYKMAVDTQLDLGKDLNKKLIESVKQRVKAEQAAGKLSPKEAGQILDTVELSGAEKAAGTLGEFIDKYKELSAAKNKLAEAKKSGDVDGAAKASKEVDALTKSVDGYIQKLQGVMSQANQFAGQAIDLLNSLSSEEGDAFSSAAKSIGAVMDIANTTLQGFQQGGIVGGAVSFLTSTLTTVFNAEKAHQAALREIEKARNATQKEYNDLLMKQNDLLNAATSIFGTNGLAQANAYAAQMKSYNDALYSKESTTKSVDSVFGRALGLKVTEYKGAIAALNNATVQTGSHKTGLFGWGGEKADYSSLLKTYPALIDGQGKLNKELAQSILDNQKLNDSSKSALQSALDYTEAYEEALSNLQNYLNSIFGDLGGELMDSITNNLNDSRAAIDDFGDYVGDAMKKMISDIAYNIYFAGMFNKLSDKITAIYSDSSMTDADKAAKATAAISSFYSGIDSAVEGATEFINKMYDSIQSQTGVDMHGNSTAKGIQADVNSMTESTGSALVGAINAMRLNVADLLKNSNVSLSQIANILSALEEIKDNTAFCKKLERIDEDIHYLKQNGIKVL